MRQAPICQRAWACQSPPSRRHGGVDGVKVTRFPPAVAQARGLRPSSASGCLALGILTVVFLVAATSSGWTQALPEGATACSVSAFSTSKDRAGAAVRAEPNVRAKILGRLAPPQKATSRDAEDVDYPADGLWRTEFAVIGFREGWFLIDRALHPYDDPERRGVLGRRTTDGVRTYARRGWISLADVGGKLTFHREILPGAIFREPRDDSAPLPARNAFGDPIQGGNSPKTVLACQADWVKVETHDGVVGWWRGLCGEPISDCGRP